MEEKAINTDTNDKNNKLYLLDMQQMDRKRISSELHDTTVQNLTMLLHKTEYISKLMDKDIIGAKLELQIMGKVLRQSISELREIIYNVRPMTIDDLGLTVSIERYLNELELENETINFKFDLIGEEPEHINSIINMTVLDIIKEICNNVKKHATATEVKVKLTYNEKKMELLVTDNGIGFDKKETLNQNKNFGLSIMKERVDLLSGILQIESKIGIGTSIKISVPLNEEELQHGSHKNCDC